MTATVQGQSRGRLRAPATRAWLRLLRVSRKIERPLHEDLRGRGLSMAQFDVLAHVGASEGMTQQELADSLLVTKGNVCQLLDRLEEGRLIVRRKEGRTNRLYLTEAGRTLFKIVMPAHEAIIEQQFSVLSAVEQAELLTHLRKLDHALGHIQTG